jgi:hypothetical protein
MINYYHISSKPKEQKKSQVKGTRICPECSHVWYGIGMQRCPECGFLPQRRKVGYIDSYDWGPMQKPIYHSVPDTDLYFGFFTHLH